MLAEALKLILGLQEQVSRPTLVTIEGRPRERFMRKHDGELESIKLDPPLRHHNVDSVDSLVAMLLDEKIAPSPAVFVDNESTVAYLDSSDRRDHVQMPHLQSAQMVLLEKMTTDTLPTRALVRALRFQLTPLNEEEIRRFLGKIESVDFRRTSTGGAVNKHGQESLGSSVEAVCQQREDVPERIELRVPVWTGKGISHFAANIAVGVFIDTEKMGFQLHVLPNQLQQARDDAVDALVFDLADQLKTRKVPVYAGSPG